MDPFSFTTGALQIAGACAQCTVTIIKICGEIRTVDARISSFCDEVGALQATYEGLEKSLSSPLMAEAARVANQTADGAHLWIQIKEALNDSRRTMRRVNEILGQITKVSGFGRKIKTHLQESLVSGELSRLRQRIQFFNAALSLPIQMVCVMLQLEQRGMTTEHQIALDNKLMSLERNMKDLVQNLSAPSRSQTLGGTTMVEVGNEKMHQDDGMKTYIAFAKQFLTTASAAASTRSSMSTVSPAIEPDVFLEGRKPSITENRLPGDHRARLEGWIQPPSGGTYPISPVPSGRSPPLSAETTVGEAEEDSEVEFMRTRRHLKLGQQKFDQSDFGKAEIHFRKALALMEENDFDGRISFQPAEVVLMLADCCLKQDKFDDAVALLEPVAAMCPQIFPTAQNTNAASERRRSSGCQQPPDKLQALAASHMLGRVFVLKEDFDSAESHGLKAFTERRKELGPRDEKTLDSVQLVIDIYRAQGDEEEAEGYEVFLSPPEKSSYNLSTEKLLSTVEESVSVTTITPPEPVQMHQVQRHQRSSFTSRLRHLGRSSHSTIAQPQATLDLHRLSISRSTTLNDALQDPDVGSPPNIRGLSSPSESSTHERSLSINDDDSITTPSSGRLERSTSSRTLEPTFLAISQLCNERKLDRAVKVAIQYLETYQSNVMIIRKMELKENIRRGAGEGLARTGRGYAPLHFFCELKEESPDEVNLLIKQGVDVNAISYQAGYTQANPKDPFTALQQATERGHSTITSLLLACEGVKTDLRDPEGMTPLMVACRKGHHGIVKQLLEFPLPTEFPATWHGSTLLHDAARRCDPVLVEILVERTIEIDERDRFSKTALMHAVVKADIADPNEKRRRVRGRCKTVQILLEAGADPTLQDHRTGLTIRDYAMKEDDNELLLVLDQIPRFGVSELLA